LQPGQKIRLPDSAGESSTHASHPSRKSSVRLKSAASRKAKRAAQKSKRLKAQLAEWIAYKKSVALQKRKRLAAQSRKQKVAARRKKLKQLAEWKAYKKALAKQRVRTARIKASKKRALALAEKKHHQDRQKVRLASAHSRRGQVRRAYSELPHAKRSTTKGASSYGSNLVRTAMAYRGARYSYGSGGGGSFDCSGFTRFVYRRALGVNLPHSSSGQFNYGRKVSRSQLKPGDLLFFHTFRSGISHVGIYVGNGKFVHAANPRRGVTIDSLNGGFYGSRLVGARRIGR
jgi:cell wall-associated NlpC family hydrolase